MLTMDQTLGQKLEYTDYHNPFQGVYNLAGKRTKMACITINNHHQSGSMNRREHIKPSYKMLARITGIVMKSVLRCRLFRKRK